MVGLLLLLLTLTVSGQSALLPNGAAFSPNGQVLAAPWSDGSLQFWDTTSGKIVRQAHATGVVALSFSADGGEVVAASGSGDVRVFDVATGNQKNGLIGMMDSLSWGALSPDGQMLALLSVDPVVQLFQVATMQKVDLDLVVTQTRGSGKHTEVTASTHVPTLVLFSPDNTEIAAAEGDLNVFLWSIMTANPQGVLHNPADTVPRRPPGHQYMAFSPDSKEIALACEHHVSVWSTRSGRLLVTLKTPGDETAPDVRCIAFSPDSHRLAAGLEDGTLDLWSLPDGKMTSSPSLHADVACLAFRSATDVVALASTQLSVWDTTSNQVVTVVTLTQTP
ncbi:MAG: WD40 repeat domain-containing protein [Candidatus Xenobia bacterium]